MEKQPESWILLTVCGICAAPLVVELLVVEPFVDGNPEKAFAVYSGLASAIGATAILCIVRKLNRRNDPRHAKRPPDAL
jgi:hypothetical protein